MFNEALLRDLPFLSTLGDALFASLLPSLEQLSFSAGARILPTGKRAGLYIIVSGRLRLRHVEHGRAIVLETFGPSEFFGEMSLFAEPSCGLSLVVVENCELVYIPRTAVVECMGHNSAAVMCVLTVAIHRLRRGHLQIADLALSTVYIRVVHVLLEHGHELNGEWHVALGSEELAELVGASREMVNKVLRCMIAKGVIRRDKGNIIVMDREAFRI
jgi:CRP/FNR family transcriptional regulator, cyclic AMP receptor protein